MVTLTEHVKASGQSDQQWADRLGISRSHFCMVRNGTAAPSKGLMARIERETGGAVTILSWFEAEAAK